jgi:glycosyltransferase involved in cell wall biosynthesis
MKPSLSIVVPAYNEEASLMLFVPELLKFCSENKFELIIVNDGSKDDTGKILESFSGKGLKVLHHKINKGYGGAIKTGIISCNTDLVITVDADGQHDLNDVKKMYENLLQENADMIVGNRKQFGASGYYRSFGKWLIRKLAKILLPVKINDINSGIKIYDSNLAKKYIKLCPDGMAYSDIIALVFISQKHKVLEIPVNISKRMKGESTISTRTAFETVIEIVNIVMLFNPMKVFLPIAIFCIAFGLAWGLQFMVVGKGVSTGALLALLTGIIFFVLGLLAEQISLLRKNQINNE